MKSNEKEYKSKLVNIIEKLVYKVRPYSLYRYIEKEYHDKGEQVPLIVAEKYVVIQLFILISMLILVCIIDIIPFPMLPWVLIRFIAFITVFYILLDLLVDVFDMIFDKANINDNIQIVIPVREPKRWIIGYANLKLTP